MPDQERLFLTIDEAIEAIGNDFNQYASQLNLLSVIWPLVFGEGTYIRQDAHNRSVWAKIPGKTKLIPASESDLKQRIMDQLRRCPPGPQHLARICAMVFGAHATAGSGLEPDALPGIWIATDMADFVCTQCGRCCRTLKYHDGCSLTDYERWRALGRTDILDWVGTVRNDGQVIACRIWVIPGTNRFAETCPWLIMSTDRDHTICTIHDLRPTICRQYPGSRKHARMTGCRGV